MSSCSGGPSREGGVQEGHMDQSSSGAVTAICLFVRSATDTKVNGIWLTCLLLLSEHSRLECNMVGGHGRGARGRTGVVVAVIALAGAEAQLGPPFSSCNPLDYSRPFWWNCIKDGNQKHGTGSCPISESHKPWQQCSHRKGMSSPHL